ncbi:MAG: hypothetical protein GZ094_20825 [Mariniphaga sp.]|nr:hypothetical protein [Mariniphaga sp.]
MRTQKVNFIGEAFAKTLRISTFALLLVVAISCKKESKDAILTPTYINFVYTSDAHYGITRATFQGATTVNAQIVNAALVKQINTVSDLTLPNDGGVKAGSKVGGINFLIETGDVSNRMEAGIQSATASYNQFITDYSTGLKLTDDAGVKTKLLLLPGNHDVSNAIGYYKTMTPLTDAGSMAGIYNLMNIGAVKTVANYNYTTDKIHYSVDYSGFHFLFVCMWPDSTERVWINKDLATVTNPVLLFTHDQPDVETKHLFNPNVSGTINSTNKFENLVGEKCKDGLTITAPSTIEQRNFASWIKVNPLIKAYFHGNDNANEFYSYTGPDNNISLNTFRVDSPMKGNISGTDETKLSFQLVTIDVVNKSMTVRECLWNTTPTVPTTAIVFGATKTISLK